MKRWIVGLSVIAVLLIPANSHGGIITIETVSVGNPGNDPDTRYDPSGYGGVSYEYNIGKYEVTAGQYRDFLNAVAATDPYGLYHTHMNSHEFGCQITQNGTPGNFTYDFSGGTVEVPGSTASDWADRPVGNISWGDAARFSNWLHNGQPTGTLTGVPAQDAGLTEDGSYNLDGAMSRAELMAVTRKPGATWVIPSEDEWYKAAYYDPSLNAGAGGYYDYPTSNNSEPSNDLDLGGNNATFNDGDYTIGLPYLRTEIGDHENSASPYDTFDQGGNVWEWNETVVEPGSSRALRGGYWGNSSDILQASARNINDPMDEVTSIGFRVASSAAVPEPSTLVYFTGLLGMGLIGYGWRRIRKR